MRAGRPQTRASHSTAPANRPERLADEHPEILAAKPRSYGPGSEFTILRVPEN
ncbi:hypothetical protein OG612_45185 (plasmid) [Streptomyces sp. NBC_01527]|uniref:hypothetical protein n=1 Tax=Streptomyces sp. NBC_01527 TaxID=2903894 RepID=UPI00386545C1